MTRLTDTRRRWLEKLAASAHPVPWGRMPTRIDSRIAITNRTWRPMIEAGWMTGKYETRDFRHGPDWYFQITDAGRAVLAAQESA